MNENIRTLRKAKGLSQEELAIKLNVVRQTVSKWEKGLSVPDSGLLIVLSEVLDTPVSVLLGETVTEPAADDLRAISRKLEVINHRFAERKENRRKAAHRIFIATAILILLISFALYIRESPYLGWDYSNPETAVVGVGFHAIEWLFARIAPIAFTGAVIGIIATGKKKGE